jgi:hypothetical protein
MVGLAHPTLRPEPLSDIEKYSQKLLDVIDLEDNELRTVTAKELLAQGTAPEQVYVFSIKKEDTLQEAFTSISLTEGRPVITFNRLLGQTAFSRVIRAAVEKIRRHYGNELDLEFAGNIEPGGSFRITLLQCRPQSLRAEQQPAVIPEVPESRILFSCLKEVPSGQVDNINYVVYIDPDEYDRIDNIPDRYEVARLIGKINSQLEREKAILLGPGRWGSNNILLGVPVKYWEINNFKLLGEIARSKSGVVPEVSFGTHFFQDLVESRIFCIPLYPDSPGVIFNDAFFANSASLLFSFIPEETSRRFEQAIRVIRLDDGQVAHVRMNGKTERGLCYLDTAQM